MSSFLRLACGSRVATWPTLGSVGGVSFGGGDDTTSCAVRLREGVRGSDSSSVEDLPLFHLDPLGTLFGLTKQVGVLSRLRVIEG